MKNFCYLFLAFFIIPFFALTQNRLLKFEHLATDEGLSQSTVLCMLHDSRGYMWFGTMDGLNKYDGYKFEVFRNDPGNKSSISNNTINEIIEAENGDLWIATLVYINKTSCKQYQFNFKQFYKCDKKRSPRKSMDWPSVFRCRQVRYKIEKIYALRIL